MKHTTLSNTTALLRIGAVAATLCLTGMWASTQCMQFLDIVGSVAHDLYASVAHALNIRII